MKGDEYWHIQGGHHGHSYQGQTLRHTHEGGAEPHGYFGHPEDGAKPERIVTSYVVNQSVPGLVVGVTDRGRVKLGTQDTGAEGGVEWLARLNNPDELADKLEHARVDAARIINELHPPERPYTGRVLAALRSAGAGGLRTRELPQVVPGLSFNTAWTELCRLRDDGCIETRRSGSGGTVWVAL